MLNALKVDPRTVVLHSLGPKFYGLGEHALGPYEDDDLCDVYLQVRGLIPSFFF